MTEPWLFAILFIVGIVLIVSGLAVARIRKQKESDMASVMYSLTHDEISNPVQSALATLTNLENRQTDPQSADFKDIASLRKSLVRLAEVTRNLRSLVMLDLPHTARTQEPLNLVGLIQSLIVELGAKADKNGVRLVYEGGDKPITVIASKEDLRRLFSNLIDNGIKYRRNVDQPNIVVSLSDEKNSVKVVISDNGVGISPERLSTLGEAPQRPDAKNIGTRGAGLGLFLSKKIVESYRGHINISSQENRGTTVSITLPITS